MARREKKPSKIKSGRKGVILTAAVSNDSVCLIFHNQYENISFNFVYKLCILYTGTLFYSLDATNHWKHIHQKGTITGHLQVTKVNKYYSIFFNSAPLFFSGFVENVREQCSETCRKEILTINFSKLRTSTMEWVLMVKWLLSIRYRGCWR